MSRLQRYTILGSAVFGVATIVLGIIMLFVFPSSAELTEGFRTPIIAFEFARSDADLAFLSGSGEPATSNRARMNAGHRWDMLFPFAYAGFVALLLLQFGLRGQRWLWLFIPLALLIIPFDIRENRILLAIIDALTRSTPTTPLLQELYVATWLKWGALGACIAALTIGYLGEKSYLSAALGACAAVAIAACRIADSKPQLTEVMSAAILVLFIAFSLRAIVQAWKEFYPAT